MSSPSIRDQLFFAGLITERQIREDEARDMLQSEMEATQAAKPAKEREKRLGILRKSTDVAQFRRESRKLLLEQPDIRLVDEIIRLAHAQGMKGKKKQGGTWLIANLYQVREALEKTKNDEERRTIVEKLFSKK